MSNFFLLKINLGGLTSTKFQEKKKSRKIEGSKLLKRLYRTLF